jgi:4-amino-4-deoxy-L-arabinose transferase-like glycosyltransferase
MRYKRILLLWVVPALFYFSLLGYTPLLSPDEGRYAEIAQHMLEHKDWLVPHLDHLVYFEKPPLVYWLTACSFQVFGYNEFAARFFPALFAWLMIPLTFSLARSMFSEDVACYSAMILTVMAFQAAVGRILTLDMTAAFFIVWALTAFYRHLKSARQLHLYLAYTACALAFLTKGLIGIVLPAGILVIFLLLTRQSSTILRLISPVGILLFVLVAGPWFYYMVYRFPGETRGSPEDADRP